METQIVHIHTELVERSKSGDRKAQYELYQQYNKAMYNISVRMMGNEGDAQDVLQDAFIDAFKNLDYYRGESTFGAWLKRIVINKCINAIKKKKLDLVPMEDKMFALADDSPQPTNHDYDMAVVNEGIKRLPDGYRTVFSLYAVEGYDHGEIAHIIGVTESTSKSQYNRAKKKLREILEELNFKRNN